MGVVMLCLPTPRQLLGKGILVQALDVRVMIMVIVVVLVVFLQKFHNPESQ